MTKKEPLPRDTRRFRQISDEPKAIVRPGAPKRLSYISTVELIAAGRVDGGVDAPEDS